MKIHQLCADPLKNRTCIFRDLARTRPLGDPGFRSHEDSVVSGNPKESNDVKSYLHNISTTTPRAFSPGWVKNWLRRRSVWSLRKNMPRMVVLWISPISTHLHNFQPYLILCLSDIFSASFGGISSQNFACNSTLHPVHSFCRFHLQLRGCMFNLPRILRRPTHSPFPT